MPLPDETPEMKQRRESLNRRLAIFFERNGERLGKDALHVHSLLVKGDVDEVAEVIRGDKCLGNIQNLDQAKV